MYLRIEPYIELRNAIKHSSVKIKGYRSYIVTMCLCARVGGAIGGSCFSHFYPQVSRCVLNWVLKPLMHFEHVYTAWLYVLN